MQWVAVAVGAFYTFAGFVVLRSMALNGLLDAALEAITLKKTDAKDRIQSRLLTFGGCLTFASGLALMTLSPWATLIFAANTIVQGAYLVWAWKALPPESEREKEGRNQTINAFVIYLAAFAFVVYAQSQGVLAHWPLDVGSLSWLIEPLAIGAVTAGVWAKWFLHVPRTPNPALDSIGSAECEESWEDQSKPPLPDRLRFAPEYGCWPTWNDDTGDNVDPADLGLPDELLARLRQWDDAWQATFKPDDPAASGFADDEEAQRWIDEGRAIAGEIERQWARPLVVII